MFAMLKLLPIILILAGGGYAYHKYVVNDYERVVSELNTQIVTYKSNEEKLKLAVQQSQEALVAIEKNMVKQQEQLGRLSTANAELTAERDRYLSIFKKHNLTKLALRKPGLIEKRINKGTNDVFRTVEADSREVDNAQD
jgi:uncharacterized protein HemX